MSTVCSEVEFLHSCREHRYQEGLKTLISDIEKKMKFKSKINLYMVRANIACMSK